MINIYYLNDFLLNTRNSFVNNRKYQWCISVTIHDIQYSRNTIEWVNMCSTLDLLFFVE